MLETNYCNLEHPWGHARSHKKMGPISFAVFTFIGYKQTCRQTIKIYINTYMKRPKREGVVNDAPYLSKEAIQTFLILFLDSMGMAFHAYTISTNGDRLEYILYSAG